MKSINQPTVSVNIGFGPDIPIFPEKKIMTEQEKTEWIKKNLPLATRANTTRVSNLNGRFDPRPMFGNQSINVQYPDARGDFGDDRSNSAPDDSGETSESHRIGFAADHLNCLISGESGPSCTHGDVDHVQRAVDCLTGYQRDEAARKQRLASVGQQHSVRFA